MLSQGYFTTWSPCPLELDITSCCLYSEPLLTSFTDNSIFFDVVRFNRKTRFSSIRRNFVPRLGILFTGIPNLLSIPLLLLVSKVTDLLGAHGLQSDSNSVTSIPASQYTSTSTTQSQLINIHLALERLRILAKRNSSPVDGNGSIHKGSWRGPRVMVVGPPSSGKTTVVKNLVNMALGSGMGWSVGVVGLDPSSVRCLVFGLNCMLLTEQIQPVNLIPGSLSLSTPIQPLPSHHLAHPLGSPPTSIPASTLSADVATLGWWYGHLEPTNRGSDVWRKIVTSIGERWRERCEKDPIGKLELLIPLADRQPWRLVFSLIRRVHLPILCWEHGKMIRKPGIRSLHKPLRHLEVRSTLKPRPSLSLTHRTVDVLLVLGHEKLTIDLTRLFSPREVRVIRVPKSGGAVDLDDNFRQVVQSFQVRTYFYGEPSLPKEISGLVGRSMAIEAGLSPYSFQIGWETLVVLRVGEGVYLRSSASPPSEVD